MAWNEVNIVDKRKQLVSLMLKNQLTVAELCRQFGISRPTAYKWLARFKEQGDVGLNNRSSAPNLQVNVTSSDIVDEILAIKFTYPSWGPKKIKATLEREKPLIEWPSTTTMGNILSRNGLVIPRKLRIRMAARKAPLFDCKESNDVWCADFKGWFLTKDKEKCDPFTLTDAFSRYLFTAIKLKGNTVDHAWAILDQHFREYGLPSRIRSDNGPPFATLSPGRLSRLSINLIKAGVIPEWIEPGKPEQNGRHERMHLTLKQESVFPGELTMEEQQMEFNQFCEYYNFIRPHEAIGQQRPGDLYIPSRRVWSGRLESPKYSKDYKVVTVKNCGRFNWKYEKVYVGRVFENEPIGLKEKEDGSFSAYYGPIYLGELHGHDFITERCPSRSRRKPTLKKGEVCAD